MLKKGQTNKWKHRSAKNEDWKSRYWYISLSKVLFNDEYCIFNWGNVLFCKVNIDKQALSEIVGNDMDKAQQNQMKGGPLWLLICLESGNIFYVCQFCSFEVSWYYFYTVPDR